VRGRRCRGVRRGCGLRRWRGRSWLRRGAPRLLNPLVLLLPPPAAVEIGAGSDDGIELNEAQDVVLVQVQGAEDTDCLLLRQRWLQSPRGPHEAIFAELLAIVGAG